MSTTLAPEPSELVAPAGQGAASPSSPPRPAGHPRRAGGLRLGAFALLVLYGCAHWVRQVAPTPDGVAAQMTGVAVVLAVALAAAARLSGVRRRRAVQVALCVVGGVAALAAAGIPLRFAGWRNWGELRAGVTEGLVALPNLNVPYRGLDEWVRWVILAGAGLLSAAAAWLAYPGEREPGGRPRHRLAAALVLCVLYGVPVVERNPERPVLSGAGFAVLLALFLGADRLAAIGGARPRLIALGGGVAALAVAALLAPRLDGGAPWIDYRTLAGDLGERNQSAFDWNHSYTPLDWPRDGREVLRVKAKRPAYWKATVLRRFDGTRWIHEPADDPGFVDTPRPAGEPSWYEDIEVTVRALRSQEYLTAGFAAGIGDPPSPAQAAGSGTYRTGARPLRTGDTYTASVYTPRPKQAQLRAAGTRYPDYVLRDLTMELPDSVGGPDVGRSRGGRTGANAATILFPPFASQAPLTTFVPGRAPVSGGGALLERSGYRRMWAAAQLLRAESSTPHELVRSIRRRVQQGTRYTERPAQRPVPLEAFLFETREGYCQQFSGAMALMLRMAGVPARVASGFTPGTFDSERGQYIVRDLDAHSWVEAYFPGIGWVTFDPTPTVAPPASQETGDGGDSAADSEAAGPQPRPDVPAPGASAPAAQGGSGGGGGGGSAPVLPVVLVALAVALAAAARWRWRHPRGVLSPLEELRRALARSGRPAAPGLTLQALERSLVGTPAAQGYVRKLRLARYAGREETTTRAERAALRDELAAGLGVRGRLRALWALPPKRPGH